MIIFKHFLIVLLFGYCSTNPVFPPINPLWDQQAEKTPCLLYLHDGAIKHYGYKQEPDPTSYDAGSSWFARANLNDHKAIRSYYQEQNGKPVTIPQGAGNKSRAWYFDRGHDHVVVFSLFTPEKQAPFIELLRSFPLDFLIIELDQAPTMLDQAWYLYEYALLDHALTIQQSIKWLRTQKKYAAIVGAGLCRSSMIYAHAQSLSPDKLFDKLLLDSPFYSLGNFIEHIAKDPIIMLRRLQKHGLPPLGRQFLSFCKIDQMVPWICKHIWGNPYEVTMQHYMPSINIPVLFVYANQDIILSTEQMNDLWNLCPSTQKALLVTNNKHARNHLRNDRELYAHLLASFTTTPFNEFLNVATKQHVHA